MSRFKNILPILSWLPNYKKSYLSGDLSAGLTVGVMLIPQGMAYAMIAGLPPVYGLYASIFPQVVYAIFGTSRQLAVGPVAMDSLLVAAGLSGMAAIGSENYIALAIVLAFMMGVIQFAFGVFRLGFLVNFLSKPVISGFTTAAALIIGANQFKHILGLELARSTNVFNILQEVLTNINQLNWGAVGVGVGGIIVIKISKKIHKSLPGALVAVVFGTLITYLFKLNEFGVKITEDIPNGLPSFAVPDLQIENFENLISVVLTLALIAFMESISIAKALHSKHRGEYEIDNNQEMIGLGLGNIVGSFFGSYPTTGGFGRSAVNNDAGAKTNLSAFFAAGLVAITLLFLTPLFYYLPNAILGAIIIVAVIGLADFKYPFYLWKTNRQDFVMLVVAFMVTLFVGIKEGILAGVAISVVMLLYRTALPHIAVLGKLPGTTDYRNVARFEDIEVDEKVLVLRHDAQLYFANIAHFVDTVKKEVSKKGPELKLLVLHCGSVSSIDGTALQELRELIVELNKNGIEMFFSGLIGPVRDYFSKTEFTEELGTEHFFIDVESAIIFFNKGNNGPSDKAFKYATQTNVFKEGI